MTGKVAQFGVLGPLQVTVDGAPIALGTPKQRAVLAVLLINRNRPVAVESLLTAAWGDDPPTGARASLHSYVSNLRKLLATAGAGKDALVSAPPGYRLSVPESDLDLGRFAAAKAAGVRAAAAGEFALAGRHLSAALAEWRGPVLEDLAGFEFVDGLATALNEDRLSAVTAHAEAEIACGRAADVITALESLTAENPFREPLWAQLITAYYLDERQHDALDAYSRLKNTLAEELGIDPGPSLRALHQKILRQEPLDAQVSARTSAVGSVTQLDAHTALSGAAAGAYLQDPAGRRYALLAVATRIGRLDDNDIVLPDANVSRHHAAVIDTGTSYVISDLRSANGIDVQHSRVRGSVGLNDGDVIRICDHTFTFHIGDGS
ncbi:regulator [Mycobacterium sp. MS1601]|uniref:BTAD domain-containing putative transcriptional regulator n=1 Tax=Mycobacterium sp. MS1601 TaxID=1936029 RepID=UPI0009795F80|nr:BTAD domain-containing putative transcriptional regulator [Mycobacterium sp. MS1601]AQA04502.1 regulator [Mycobacterium sp. MS1601]